MNFLRWFRRSPAPLPPATVSPPMGDNPQEDVSPPHDPGVQYRPAGHAFGLDISDGSLKAVELRRRGTRDEVIAHSFLEIPPEVVERGEIHNPAALTEAIRSLVKNATPRPFSTPNVVFSLGESNIYIHPFEFPETLTELQVRRAVPYEAEGELPIAVKDTYTDLEFHRSRDRSHHVLFAAARRSVVDEYIRVLAAAGLRPLVAELESLALTRALVRDQDEPVLILDVGSTSSTITTVERKTVHGAVIIPIGGVQLTLAIAAATGGSVEDAERTKRENGFEGGSAEVRAAITTTLAPLVREARNAAQYHQAHTGRPVIQCILSGGTARLKGLTEFLKEQLQLDVVLGDPLTARSITLTSAYSENDRAAFLGSNIIFVNSLGLALRGVEHGLVTSHINLLPPTVRHRYADWWIHGLFAGVSLASVAIVLALTLALGVWTVGRVGEQLSTVEQATSVSEAGGRTESRAALALAEAANREVGLLRAFDHSRIDVGGLLRDIRRLAPPGIRFTSISVVSTAGEQAPRVVISGIAPRREDIRTYETALRTIKGVKAVQSPVSNVNRPTEAPFVFTLLLDAPENPLTPSASPNASSPGPVSESGSQPASEDTSRPSPADL